MEDGSEAIGDPVILLDGPCLFADDDYAPSDGE